MYKFVDTNSRGGIQPLPAEAMCFNGFIFENEIEGYRTLSVSGREGVNRSIISHDVLGRDGALFSTSSLKSRTLTVKYQMLSEDAREFRHNFNRLNAMLIGEEVPIHFADESHYTFYGTVVKMRDPEEGKLNVVSEIEIFCSDPFKYDAEDDRTGIGSVIINEQFDYKILPERIIIVPQANVPEIVLTSGDKQIKLIDGFLSGKEVEVDFNACSVKVNGVYKPRVMTFSSDIEDFFIESNGEITVNPSMEITVIYRRKM